MCPNCKVAKYVNGKVYLNPYKNDISPILNNPNLYLDKLQKNSVNYWFFIPCGKCPYCLEMKKLHYANRLKEELAKNEYKYLITITLNDKNIKKLGDKKDIDNPNSYLNQNISKFSTLSKVQINNIIRNWKQKFNKYYKTKIDFNYFLCGEYGDTTHRAHYHIVLMLSHPIPSLEKQQVKGQHYKSKIFKSKQYGHYDIELINDMDSLNVSKYITKYLTKQNENKPTYNYSLNEEKSLFKDIVEQNKISEYMNNEDKPNIYFQAPFIKKSKYFGMDKEDMMKNIENGTITLHYINKLFPNKGQMLKLLSIIELSKQNPYNVELKNEAKKASAKYWKMDNAKLFYKYFWKRQRDHIEHIIFKNKVLVNNQKKVSKDPF